jgi:hypothetical protein
VEKEIEMGQPIGWEDIPQGIRNVAERYGDLGSFQGTSTLAEHFWSCSQARRRTTWEARREDSTANLAYSRAKCQPGKLTNDEVPTRLDVLTTPELNRLVRQYIKGMCVKLTRQEWNKEYISPEQRQVVQERCLMDPQEAGTRRVWVLRQEETQDGSL